MFSKRNQHPLIRYWSVHSTERCYPILWRGPALTAPFAGHACHTVAKLWVLSLIYCSLLLTSPVVRSPSVANYTPRGNWLILTPAFRIKPSLPAITVFLFTLFKIQFLFPSKGGDTTAHWMEANQVTEPLRSGGYNGTCSPSTEEQRTDTENGAHGEADTRSPCCLTHIRNAWKRQTMETEGGWALASGWELRCGSRGAGSFFGGNRNILRFACSSDWIVL